MPDLPSGTVTFVFSDLEGSTALLKRLGDAGYTEMLRVHRKIVRDVFAAHDGSEIDTQGDAFFYSFSRARAAVAAAVEVQRRHAAQEWIGGARVKVRLGLHTGEPVVGDEGYTGLDVVRAARIAADGKGGQILLSEATRAIVGDDLPEGVGVRELGERTLKDIDKPEPLYELVYGAPEHEMTARSSVSAGLLPLPSARPASVLPPSSVDLDSDDPTDIKSWLKIASEAIRQGDNFDPGPLIEERVLRQIERNTRNLGDKKTGKDKSSRPAPPEMPDWMSGKPGKKSVADQLERLQELRESGALNDEQYAKAVDRVLSEG